MLLLGGIAASGCTTGVTTSPLSAPQGTPAQTGTSGGMPEPSSPSPHALASLQLTEQAQRLLEGGKADEAISILERAVTLNPANGRNYYYLSEAWLLKKDTAQAYEFNHLAAIYVEGDPTWMSMVWKQKERIESLGKQEF